MSRLWLILFLIFQFQLFGQTLVLDGHLGKEEADQAEKSLIQWKEEGVGSVLLVVRSISGDLNAVLEFSKKLYEWKQTDNPEIVVYIDGDALGPAAILPFLSDRLETSLFVSWGDVPLGGETALPVNILRSRVLSLISDDHPKAELLKILARGMIDKSLTQVLLDGTVMISGATDAEGIISGMGETLVLNHKQLQKLGLVEKMYPFSELGIEKKEIEEVLAVKTEKAPLMERLEESITFSQEGPNPIGRIVIEDRKAGINQGTWLYVKTALDHYKKIKPAFIILELNTPGGEVFASQQISNALKEIDTKEGIPVVAYINDWAISAGAMLAYSCRFIAGSENASMGAAEPVIQAEGGMKEASEKINSALRTDFGNRAQFFGRNSDIAKAMVDKDIILVLRHGRIVKLDSEEQIQLTGPDPDQVITAKGKLLTLDTDQMLEYGVADFEVETEILTEPFFDQIPNAKIETFELDWKTQFFVFLANPVVAGILFMGVLVGFYVEINTPGFGVPGGIGLSCLFLILLSSFAMEAVNWFEVIILGVGLTLLLVDVFVLPSFGILGSIGILLFIGGLFALMLPGIEAVDYEFDTQTWNAAGEFVINRLVWLSIAFILGIVIIALLARYALPYATPFNRFVLAGREQDAKEGFIAGEDPSKLPPPGSKGKVVATLRPSGKILIEDKIYEAVSTGEYIEQGVKIQVLRLEGSVIVVEEIV